MWPLHLELQISFSPPITAGLIYQFISLYLIKSVTVDMIEYMLIVNGCMKDDERLEMMMINIKMMSAPACDKKPIIVAWQSLICV